MSVPAPPPDTSSELCPQEQSNIIFNENSPRPPVVPGEETETNRGAGTHSPSSLFLSSGWSSKLTRGGASSPVLMPRRSSLSRHNALPDGAAPLGFEPEGRCSPCVAGDLVGIPSSPPSYLRWARNLPSLLEDPDGVDLFRRYLESEGRSHADTLDFWFACEGLRKQTDPEKISQLVKVIYRRFFLKTQLGVGEDLRKAVNRRIKEASGGSGELDCGIFDASQQEVERLITETTYPNFLHSDLYLAHVQSMQNGSSSSSGSSSGGSGCGRGEGMPTNTSGMLATVHEDTELINTGPEQPLPLTRDMLMVTQKRRAADLRPKPEAYAGVYLQTHKPTGVPHPHHPYHFGRLPAYSSYNPVSRQDSELQSLSSDARTESDMSLTDSSVDGTSTSGHHRFSRKQYQRHCRQMKEAANLNRDPYMHHTVIPRTQRIQKEQVHPMKPDEFAAILIDKLEGLKRNQEAQEKLDRKLMEGKLEGDCCIGAQKSLADTIREKFQMEDVNDQDILDQHVSRVWSDLTPSRTPGLSSPRPKSPDTMRRSRSSNNPPLSKVCVSGGGSGLTTHINIAPHPYQSRPYPRHTRKEKDVFSTFSSDSGNVHDFTEGSEHRHHIPKSKSMPDYVESQDMYSSLPGHEPRFRQSREGSRRWSSKKTELTDSGVSVVSDTPPVSHPSSQFKDSRVLSWLMDSDKQQMCGGVLSTHSERDSNSSCSIGQSKSHRIRNVGSRGPQSRSTSLERSSNNPAPPAPAQPFVADPSMPPLPSPDTATQLEEARRRLLEDEGRSKSAKQRLGISGKNISLNLETSQSGGSTLRRGGKSGSGGRGDHPDSYTTVVFSFCDEQFPYRTKIPNKPVTLRQFKEYLPKKGTYRYFFKTECEDLDMRVIQEEITDDNEILPLWDGKIMAQVKPVE